jgi:hypothetical protein
MCEREDGLQCIMVSPVNLEATKRTTSSSATGGMTSLHCPIYREERERDKNRRQCGGRCVSEKGGRVTRDKPCKSLLWCLLNQRKR